MRAEPRTGNELPRRDVAGRDVASDVVELVVALLSELPPHERLGALGRVQSQLLSGLVQEEVRRATGPPRQG